MFVESKRIVKTCILQLYRRCNISYLRNSIKLKGFFFESSEKEMMAVED